MPFDDSSDAEIEHVVHHYLRQRDSGIAIGIDELCRLHLHLEPKLREELEKAERIRSDRQAAQEIPFSGDYDQESMTSGPDIGPTGARAFHEYELLERLGAGGFGTVYSARHVLTGDLYAIKLLHKDRCDDPQALLRFQAELEIAKRLTHPHLVAVLASGEYAGRPYIVMPLIDGTDLQRHFRGMPVDPLLAAQIVGVMASACDYAHQQGVIHRDIKPANILIDHQTGIPCLTDFGLARLEGKTSITDSLQPIGTLSYMPPEQADRRLGPIGPAADIYALGATLYFLLTGRPPFPRTPGSGSKATLHDVLWAKPIPLPTSVPKPLRTICYQCLQKHTQDRYRSASELSNDLGRFAQGRPILGQLPGPWRRGQRAIERRPLLAAAMAILILTFTSAVALLIASRQAMNRLDMELAESAYDKAHMDYAAAVHAAGIAFNAGSRAETLRLLDPYTAAPGADHRGFEWHYLMRQLRPHATVSYESPPSHWRRFAISEKGHFVGLKQDGTVVGRDQLGDSSRSKLLFERKGDWSDCAFTPDGQYLILLDAKRSQLSLFRPTDGSSIANIDVPPEITCLSIHPKLGIAATGHRSGNIFISDSPWSATSRSWKQVLPGSPKSKPARAESTTEQGEPDSNHPDGLHPSNNPISRKGEAAPCVTAIVHSQKGDQLAVGRQNGTVELVTLRSAPGDFSSVPIGRDRPIAGIAFSSDDSKLAIQYEGTVDPSNRGYRWGEVIVWDIAASRSLCELDPSPPVVQKSKADDPASPAQRSGLDSHDHRFSLNSNSNSTVGSPWFLPLWSGHPRDSYPLRPSPPIFVRNDLLLATVGPGGVHFWDIKTGQLNNRCGVTDEDVFAMSKAAMSGTSISMTTLGSDGKVRGSTSKLPNSRPKYFVPNEASQLAISPDGSTLAVIGRSLDMEGKEDGNRCIFLFPVAPGGIYWRTEPFPSASDHVYFTNDSEHVVCGSVVHRVIDGAPQRVLWAEDFVGIPDAEPLLGFNHQVALIYSRSAPIMRIIRTARPSVFQDIPLDEPVVAAAISQDERWVATGSVNGSVIVWSIENEKISRRSFQHGSEVTFLAFSPRGDVLAAAAKGRDIRLWAIGGRWSQRLSARLAGINGLAFSPDGSRLVSASGLRDTHLKTPGELLLWDVRTGSLLLQLSSERDPSYGGVAFSPDGQTLFATESDPDHVFPAVVQTFTTIPARTDVVEQFRLKEIRPGTWKFDKKK